MIASVQRQHNRPPKNVEGFNAKHLRFERSVSREVASDFEDTA